MKIGDKYASDQNSVEELEQLTKQLLQAHLDENARQRYQKVLADQYGFTKPKQSIGSKRLWNYLAIAASVSILLIIGVNLLTRPSYTALRDQYITEHFPSSEERKGPNSSSEIQSAARVAYQSKAFDQSALLYEQLNNQENATEDDQLFLALSYLYQSPAQSDKAIVTFKNILARQNSKRAEIARWHLALAYLQKENLNESKALLEIIVREQTWKHAKAKRLLKSLP